MLVGNNCELRGKFVMIWERFHRGSNLRVHKFLPK